MRSRSASVFLLLSFFFALLLLPLFLLFTLDLSELEHRYLERQERSIERELINNSFKKTIDCKVGEWPCIDSLNESNQTICVPRELHCDSIVHCPNGEDERDCVDLYGHLDRLTQHISEKYYSLLHNDSVLTDLEYFQKNCTLSEISMDTCPVKCDLTNYRKVYCRSQSLIEIPQNLSDTVTLLNLDNNSITVLDAIVLRKYPQLITLSLNNNSLAELNNKSIVHLEKLKNLFLNENQITFIENNALSGLRQLTNIEIRDNNLKFFNLSMLSGCDKLKFLDLSNNQLVLQNEKFPVLPNLEWIDISKNQIEVINEKLFQNLNNVWTISLSENLITQIDSHAFANNVHMVQLSISHNLIAQFHSNVFHNLKRLTKLEMSHNPTTVLPVQLFCTLTRLASLDLSGLTINNIRLQHFVKLTQLRHIYFSQFRYCMYAPKARVCRPFSDQLSSLSNLLASSLLRTGVWSIGIATLLANLCVLFWRTFQPKKNAALCRLAKNLAASDLLMGTYLLIIAAHDAHMSGDFNRHALRWTQSWQCSFSGFLALFSSELSLLLVLLITLDRYRCIVCPYRASSGLASSSAALTSVWILSFLIAVFPLIYYSSIQGTDYTSTIEQNQFDIYGQTDNTHHLFAGWMASITNDEWNKMPNYFGSNSLCFPLHLNEPYLLGWRFSALILLVLNGTLLLTIGALYCKMYLRIRSDRQHVRPPLLVASAEDARLALRFLSIVFTNAICWAPIVLAKALAMCGMRVSPTVHAWLVIFILPVNSALNPLIYSATNPIRIWQRARGKWLLWSSSLSWVPSSNRSTRNSSTCGRGSGTGVSNLIPVGINTNMRVDNKMMRKIKVKDSVNKFEDKKHSEENRCSNNNKMIVPANAMTVVIVALPGKESHEKEAEQNDIV